MRSRKRHLEDLLSSAGHTPSLTTDVGLVLQTISRRYVVTVCVPTRPGQNDPDRARAWAAVRAQVGRRVLALRLERGITQEDLALSADIDRSLLIDVEKGRRSLLIERLYDLAQALDVPITEILRGNEEA
jgi:DNA-binding XRE family transcriptional regulator